MSVPSAFDPAVQHANVDAKLVAALERLSQAFRSLLWEEAKASGLSPIQIQLLINLRFHPASENRVGDLAREFDLTNATVSEALSTLVAKGLLTKEPSPDDRRARVLRLTARGRQQADRLGGWAEVVGEHLGVHSNADKVFLLRFLMDLIAGLQEAGVISVARMCSTCRFFDREGHADSDAPHYCRLLQKPLYPSDLRIDCPEHEQAMAT